MAFSAGRTAGRGGTGAAQTEVPVEPRAHIFVQAHRGSTTDYPELTLAAFEAAVAAGVDRIEMVDGRAELNLEVKTNRRSWLLVDRVIEETVSLVEEMGAEEHVLYSSFEVEALLKVRERDSDARLLLIDWLPGASYDGVDIAVDNNLYAWSPSADHITEERVQKARRAGLSTHVGAAPGPRALEYIEWGIDGLSSGNPAELVRFLEREGVR